MTNMRQKRSWETESLQVAMHELEWQYHDDRVCREAMDRKEKYFT